MKENVIYCMFDGSGIMGLPWAIKGYKVYCFNADSGDHGEYSIRMVHPNIQYVNIWIDKDFDVKRSILGIPDPDFIFAFPSCTLLAHSGIKHVREDNDVLSAADDAKMVERLGNEYGCPWMVENPVGKLSSLWRKPDFYFHPRDFGGYVSTDEPVWHPKMPHCDNYTKKTCIWHGNGFVEPKRLPPPDGVEGVNFFWAWKFLGGRSERTKMLRSITPRGFARAVFQANYRE